jgi:hypothetical protein
MKKANKALGIMMNMKTTPANHWDSHTSVDLDFNLIRIGENEAVTNIGHSFGDDPFKWLDNIAMSTRLYTGEYNKDTKPFDWYGSIYLDAHHPDVNEVERAAKSLKSINKAMDSLNKLRGFVLDHADWAGRFCEACGVGHFVTVVGPTRGWHNENTHRFMSIGEGIGWLRTEVAKNEIFQAAVKKAMGRSENPPREMDATN